MRNQIIKYSLLLLAGFLIEWLFFTYMAPGFPEKIKGSNINIHGLLIFTWLLFILIRFQRAILRIRPETQIPVLTVLGILVFIFGELLFQVIQLTVSNDLFEKKKEMFPQIVLSFFILGSFISLCIAIQIKAQKTWIVVLLILAGLVFFALSHTA